MNRGATILITACCVVVVTGSSAREGATQSTTALTSGTQPPPWQKLDQRADVYFAQGMSRAFTAKLELTNSLKPWAQNKSLKFYWRKDHLWDHPALGWHRLTWKWADETNDADISVVAPSMSKVVTFTWHKVPAQASPYSRIYLFVSATNEDTNRKGSVMYTIAN